MNVQQQSTINHGARQHHARTYSIREDLQCEERRLSELNKAVVLSKLRIKDIETTIADRERWYNKLVDGVPPLV